MPSASISKILYKSRRTGYDKYSCFPRLCLLLLSSSQKRVATMRKMLFGLILLFGICFADDPKELISLKIETEPADALIYVKHESWEERRQLGKTPQSEIKIPKGKIELILLKDNYLPIVEEFDSTQKSSFRFQMHKSHPDALAFQNDRIPAFVIDEREGFKVFKQILTILVNFYVEEHPLDRYIEAAVSKLVNVLNQIRWRRKTIEKAYPDLKKREKFYETFSLKPDQDLDLSHYDALGYYVKRTDKRVEIYLNTGKRSLFLEIDPEKERTSYFAFIGILDFLKKEYDRENKLSWDFLYYTAIQGMLDFLQDEHTSFLDPRNWEKTREETKAAFGGVGIQVYPNKKERYLEIISPIADSPAAKAGLLPKDRIIQVESLVIADLDDPQKAIDSIRGEPGTEVLLTIERPANDEEKARIFKVSLKRDIIKLVYIKEEMLPDQIGYIRITSFMDENLVEKFTSIFNDLLKKGAKGLILDLRNNPGGLLVNALRMADLFIEEGPILETRGRLPANNKKTEASSIGTYPKDIPLVILVNEGSASASEIVSGALQDYDRAILVGKKTFGKGSVLELYPIQLPNDRKVGLAFTISKYFLPKGECIHKLGIKPNFEIDVTEEVRAKILSRSIYNTEPRDYDDTQLKKAIELIKEKNQKQK